MPVVSEMAATHRSLSIESKNNKNMK